MRPDIADAPDAVDLAVAERGRQGTKGSAGEEGGVQGLPRGGASGAVGAGRASKGESDVRGHVRYRDVHFSYDGEHEVLRGLDLDVPAGCDRGARGAVAAAARPPPARFCPGSTTRRAARWRSTASTSATVTVESLRRRHRHRAAGRVPVRRHHPREHRLRAARTPRMPEIVEAARQARTSTTSSMSLPEGYDTLGGRARRAAVGRAEAAHRHRARVSAQPAHPHPGRGHERARQRERARHPGSRSGSCPRAAPRSSSRTGSPPYAAPTSSRWWRAAAWWSRARTSELRAAGRHVRALLRACSSATGSSASDACVGLGPAAGSRTGRGRRPCGPLPAAAVGRLLPHASPWPAAAAPVHSGMAGLFAPSARHFANSREFVWTEACGALFACW